MTVLATRLGVTPKHPFGTSAVLQLGIGIDNSFGQRPPRRIGCATLKLRRNAALVSGFVLTRGAHHRNLDQQFADAIPAFPERLGQPSHCLASKRSGRLLD